MLGIGVLKVQRQNRTIEETKRGYCIVILSACTAGFEMGSFVPALELREHMKNEVLRCIQSVGRARKNLRAAEMAGSKAISMPNTAKAKYQQHIV